MLAATRLRGLKRGFTPTQIAGLTAWYDFADATTLFEDTARTDPVDVDTDLIKGVTDKSGQGNHLSEATNPPVYRTGILNGNSCARFDGTDDRLFTALTLAQPMTIFGVCGKDATNTEHFFDGDGGTNRVVIGRLSDNWALYAGTILSDGAADTANHIFCGVFNGGSSKIRVAGGAGTGGAGGAQGFSASLYLFHSPADGSYGLGDWYEMLIYNSSLSLGDMNLVGNYLEAKWNLTWTDAS